MLPSLFELRAGNFYIALAGEKDRERVLKIIRQPDFASYPHAGVHEKRKNQLSPDAVYFRVPSLGANH